MLGRVQGVLFRPLWSQESLNWSLSHSLAPSSPPPGSRPRTGMTGVQSSPAVPTSWSLELPAPDTALFSHLALELP